MKLNKKYSIIAIIAALIIIPGGYFYFFRSAEIKYDFVLAQRSDLSQEVSVTGRVKPSENVELAFEKSGKISRVYAEVGSDVNAGQALVGLDDSELLAKLSEAESGVGAVQAGLQQYEGALEQEQIKLKELERGTRIEEIQVQEVKISNAKIALEDAKNNLVDKLQDAYTKSDDAVRGKTDQMFTNPQMQNPELKFWDIDSNLENDIEWKRLLLEYNVFLKWKTSLDRLTIQSDFTTYIAEAKKYLDEVKIFLDKISLVVNNSGATYIVNQVSTEIPSSWKTDTATARTNINTAIANLTTAEEKFKTAESSLALYEQELVLKKAGTTTEQIAAQEAQIKQANARVASQQSQIKQAQANVQNIQAQIAKTVIHSPINGIITKQDAKIGEIISANTSVVWLISESQFEIEANIPEADIAKVHVGNSASVNLDAYPDVFFDANVTSIDPAETIIEGVATYKTTLQFIKEDSRIKSGMTANIDILSEKIENAISIPQRSIISKNGDKFVKILNNDKVEEVKIIIGIKGMNGYVEVIDGIKEGDKIITSIK